MNDNTLNQQPKPIPERLDTQWVMVFNLIVGQGRGEAKKTYKVNKKRLVIGSALSSDIRIQQNAVSNVHCVVEMDENGQAHVFDMASETGVFLNGNKILSEDLKDGDELKVGFATLTYKRLQVSEAQAQMPAGAVRASSSGHRKLFYDSQEDFRPLILEDERNVIQIFDYPSAAEQALQVVMYWGDVILDVKHLVSHKDVTLGEGKDATFPVPGIPSAFPLVTFEGAAAQLHIDRQMGGVVRSGKQLMALDQVSGGKFHLKQNDLAKIEFKDLSFFVSYSPVPPHLKRQRVLERDPLYTRIWFTSIVLTLAMVMLLVGIDPPEKLETEELPPRVATIIFKQVPPPPPPVKRAPPTRQAKPKPPKPKPKPRPKPTPPPKPKPKPKPPEPPKAKPKPVVKPPKTPRKTKPVEHTANQVKGKSPRPRGGNSGAGARHAGKQGQAGVRHKPKNGPPMNRSSGRARHSGARTNTPNKSQVRGAGNVEALFSDIGGNISKSLAGGGAAGAGAAGKNLRAATGPVDSGGAGAGSGLIGSGSGGGGSSLTSAGLGNHGNGFGLSGSGKGRIGSGGDLHGTGHGRPNVEVGNASETIIMGGLDKSVIDEYIRRHMNQIRNCYEKELSSSQNLSGRVATRFVISGSGRVTQAGVSSSSIDNSNVERCLIGVLKRIVFPEPLGGGIVEVDYPFAFQPSVAGK